LQRRTTDVIVVGHRSPSCRHHPSPKSLKRLARHNSNNSIKCHLLALRIMRHTPSQTTVQRRQSSQVVQVGMQAPSNINIGTLHQQVRHPYRPHHCRHQIGARSILPRILRRVRSRYQRRRPRPGANWRHLFRRPPVHSASDPPIVLIVLLYATSHRWWQ
jgi:hypothetical protein